MAVNPDAAVRISAFSWVPDFAQGYVRDFRVRWALEEAGIDYRVKLLNATTKRSADYFAEQPFGQVPSYKDDEVELFESGAIVLHIARKALADGDDVLMPSDSQGQARALAWTIAALNSVEPFVMQLPVIDIFHKGEAWTVERRPQAVEEIKGRMQQLADHLGEREYLEESFTAGDLIMAGVLRGLDGSDVLAGFPNLAAYQERCLSRPAYKRAIDAQMADFLPAPAAA